MTLYGCTIGTRLGYIIMGIEYLQAFSSICHWCCVKSGGFYYPSVFKVILIVHLVYTKWNVYFSLQHRTHYLCELFEEGLPWDCLDLPRTFHSAFGWLLLIYREICADICIICVHECLSNLMTSTQQRQFSSWYHFVALSIGSSYKYIPAAKQICTKLIQGSYCLYLQLLFLSWELLDFLLLQLVVIQ